MITPNKAVGSMKNILKAYVAVKSGYKKNAAKLFVKACEDENIDVVMDGIGQAIQDIEAQEELDDDLLLDDETEEEEVEDDEELEGDIFSMDIEEDEPMEDEDEDDLEAGISVPKTVANVLNLRY